MGWKRGEIRESEILIYLNDKMTSELTEITSRISWLKFFTKIRNCTYHMHFLPFVLYVDFVQFQGYKIVSSNALLILHWYLNINKYSRNSGFTHRMSEAVGSKLSRPNWLAKVTKDMVFSFRSSQLNMILNVVNCLIYT